MSLAQTGQMIDGLLPKADSIEFGFLFDATFARRGPVCGLPERTRT
jgi:hypothetical protein